MATKADIANMATKADIANMATKADIANMATKADIANMATKDDIKRLEGALFRFENNAERKFDALFDGYSQNTEAIYELRRDIEHLKAIVEQHEVKLKIVK
ncbi:MAG TPA: hypothetical protein PLL98_06605 [Bacillota bacterium]|nr:hypothetical protein [Bacillota bacterium]